MMGQHLSLNLINNLTPLFLVMTVNSSDPFKPSKLTRDLDLVELEGQALLRLA